MATAKPHINLIFIGHVDHGKSTTVGRMLYDAGAISEQEMKKLKTEAHEKGKDTFEFAFKMDKLKEERERGVTIDLMHEKFETPKHYFTIIDAPGHKDFIKNMITGASQADAAVLVVAAKEGVMAQTKEHIYLSKTLGIGQLIVAVNKMDTVNYAESNFNEVKEAVGKIAASIGFKIAEIQFVPIASLPGDNVVKKSDKLSWFKGPTLLDAIEGLKTPEKPTTLPLRLPVQDAYNIKGIGTVPVGRVETGIMKPNDKIIVQPSGAVGEVKSIEMHHEQMAQAEPGDNVGFNVRGIGAKEIKRGSVIGHVSNPPTVAKEIIAQIIVLDHPSVITKGYTPVLHVHTAQVACKFEEIQKKLDPKTGLTLQEHPDFIKSGDAAIVKLVPTKPLCIEKAKDIPPMGRFAIRDMGATVAAGIVLDIVKR